MDLTNRFPVRTKALTAAILNLFGDLFCQVASLSPPLSPLHHFAIFLACLWLTIAAFI